MIKEPISVNSKEGREIYEFLRKRLDIPDNVQSFDLVFCMNDVIRIKNMNYTPGIPVRDGRD